MMNCRIQTWEQAWGLSAANQPDTILAILWSWWYWLRLGFVGAVSAYDAYLTYLLRDVILYTELNPIGLWLIRLDPQNLIYFTAAKATGTASVLALLATAARRPYQNMLRRPRAKVTAACWSDPAALRRLLFNRLAATVGRFREVIVSCLATFQLWLLWYLTFE